MNREGEKKDEHCCDLRKLRRKRDDDELALISIVHMHKELQSVSPSSARPVAMLLNNVDAKYAITDSLFKLADTENSMFNSKTISSAAYRAYGPGRKL